MVPIVLLVLVLPMVGFHVSYVSSGFHGSSCFCGSCESECTMEHVQSRHWIEWADYSGYMYVIKIVSQRKSLAISFLDISYGCLCPKWDKLQNLPKCASPWNLKFHPSLHEVVDVRKEDFIRNKISWMHRHKNFLTHVAPLKITFIRFVYPSQHPKIPSCLFILLLNGYRD